MKRTLLLCFIHGFKGDDNTFASFPEHLQALVQHALPEIHITAVTYPQFETRGELGETVSRFREWLQNKVIDLEVENETPSPTVDPSVRCILAGHSMGGIVAAETLLAIANEQPLSESTEAPSMMFPYIQGVLAFDTPYLGIAPGVVAYGAEGHYKSASSTFNQLSGLAGGLGLWGGGTASQKSENQKPTEEEVAQVVKKNGDAAATPAWQRWGKVAMFAGAAGAVAAGGAAAYMKRDQLSEGWGWVGSHLEFVGCLVKGEDLRKRVHDVVELEREKEIGFGVIYTQLGRAAAQETGQSVARVVADKRTFCSLPREKSEVRGYWNEAINDMAKDEIQAHIGMFSPRLNPGFYEMSDGAKDLISSWVSKSDWNAPEPARVEVPENKEADWGS